MKRSAGGRRGPRRPRSFGVIGMTPLSGRILPRISLKNLPALILS
jgi:hypothetical protein